MKMKYEGQMRYMSRRWNYSHSLTSNWSLLIERASICSCTSDGILHSSLALIISAISRSDAISIDRIFSPLRSYFTATDNELYTWFMSEAAFVDSRSNASQRFFKKSTWYSSSSGRISSTLSPTTQKFPYLTKRTFTVLYFIFCSLRFEKNQTWRLQLLENVSGKSLTECPEPA